MNEDLNWAIGRIHELEKLIRPLGQRDLRYGQPKPTRSFGLPMGAGNINLGAPNFAERGTQSVYTAWAYDAAAGEIVQWEWLVPRDYLADLAVRLYWTNLGAGAGDVVWNVAVYWGSDSEDLDAAAHTASSSQTLTAPAQNVLETSDFALTTTLTPGDYLNILVTRSAAVAGDTLANDAGIVGIEFTYSAIRGL